MTDDERARISGVQLALARLRGTLAPETGSDYGGLSAYTAAGLQA